jgi:MFS family permease
MTTLLSAPSRPDRRRWWVLAVLCLSVLLVVVDNTIVNVALPTLSRKLSASTQDLQWIVDGYTLVFAGLLLVGGNLGDRLGRKRMLQAGLVLFALTSVGSALARSTGELIAGRAAMGVAAALIYPATLALLNSTFTVARERATAIGIWSGVSGLAVAIGPVTGGLLLRHFAWSSVFYVNVPIAAVALVAGLRLLPESRDPQAGRFDPLGALTSIWSTRSSRARHAAGAPRPPSAGSPAPWSCWPGSPGRSCAARTRCSTCGCSATPGSPPRARRSHSPSSASSASSS